MKKLIAILLILSGFYLIHINSAPAPIAIPVSTPAPTSQVKGIPLVSPLPADPLISVVNLYRSSKGLEPFVYNPSLAVAAQKRAQYLVENNQWSHDKFAEQLHQAGFYVGGENLAMGFDSDEAIVQAWSLSKKHAELMFSRDYHSAGIGRAGNIVVLWMWEGR